MILQRVLHYSRVHKTGLIWQMKTQMKLKRVSTKNQTWSSECFATQIFLVIAINLEFRRYYTAKKVKKVQIYILFRCWRVHISEIST